MGRCRRRSPELGFASALCFQETWKVHVLLSPWVQLTLPLLNPSLHEPPCCLGRGFCFVYRRHSWAQCPLLAAVLSQNWVQCQQKLELFTSNCVDDQDGPRDRMSPLYFRLFLVLLNTHRIEIQSSIEIGKGILSGSTFSLQE